MMNSEKEKQIYSASLQSSPPPTRPKTVRIEDPNTLQFEDVRRRVTDAPKSTRENKKDKAYKSQPSKAMQNQMNGASGFSQFLKQKYQKGSSKEPVFILPSNLVQLATLFLVSKNVHFLKAIPAKKEENVRKICERILDEEDEIVVLYDDTVFGSGKDGFIMTPRGLYWYSGEGPPKYIYYGDIIIGTGDKETILNFLGGVEKETVRFDTLFKDMPVEISITKNANLRYGLVQLLELMLSEMTKKKDELPSSQETVANEARPRGTITPIPFKTSSKEENEPTSSNQYQEMPGKSTRVRQTMKVQRPVGSEPQKSLITPTFTKSDVHKTSFRHQSIQPMKAQQFRASFSSASHEELHDWLVEKNLQNLFPFLLDLGVEDFDSLKLIREEDFKSYPEVKPVHIRKLFIEISNLRNREKKKSTKDVTIVGNLAQGEFGDIFEGIWQGSTRVAMKKLFNMEFTDAFSMEASMLMKLRHPNVVNFFGIFKSPENEQYLVTELLPLGNLRDVLQDMKDSLSIRDLVQIAMQIVSGMQYLSACNVLHRDLAARNILIKKDETGESNFIAKVSDFGLSRQVDSDFYRMSAQSKVPIRWTATEVLGTMMYTKQSDIFSFGVVLWEIFSYGLEPYTGYTNLEVLKKVLEGERNEPPPNCPNEIKGLMIFCWKDAPILRPSWKQIFNTLNLLKGNDTIYKY